MTVSNAAMSQNSVTDGTITIFDPRGAKDISRLHAPRLDTMVGKRIAFLTNGMWQADRTLPRLLGVLAARFPTTEFLAPDRFPGGNEAIQSDETMAALRANVVDAVIVGNAACGACATACGRAAARIEAKGLPTAMFARDTFSDVAKNAFTAFGFDQEAAMVRFPIELFLPDGDLSAVDAAVDAFVAALTAWQPLTRSIGAQTPRMIEMPMSGPDRKDPVEVVREVNRVLMISRCGDGLVLLPPTERLVSWILQGSSLPRDHVVGRIMPRGGIASIETIAVSLAMAGGRPEYLSVLVAILEAILDPVMEHGKGQANSGSPFPVAIVNGPVGQQIRLNSGFGLLGPNSERPAGGSIGRALRLLLQNVGGALPGSGTMAAYGSMRYTNAIFAEADDELPAGWTPVSADFGGNAHGNNVTVFAAVGGVSTPRRAISADNLEREIVRGLHRVCAYMRTPNRDYVVGWAHGVPGALLISPTVARQFIQLGWTKPLVQDFLWEHSKVERSVVERSGLEEWLRAAPDPETRAAPIDPWPICGSPRQIPIVVAGGDHPSNHFWFTADAPAIATRAINLPANWDELLIASERDLGPGGTACMV